MEKYNHQQIEKKWQKYWQESKVFEVRENKDKPKFYGLIEFPYPSGDGLHTGHLRSNTAMDIICRKRRMQGYNVLYPIGFDAFGLPAENYAIKVGVKPQISIAKNIEIFTRQLKEAGFSFDWSRSFSTTDPDYYKWTQWIFVQMFKHGLAYKAKKSINWCTACKIGLANEEVVNGKCERCGGEVIKKDKEQWILKITKYADHLIKDLDLVDYLERIKTQQINWIGRSEGAEVRFPIKINNKVVLIHGKDTNAQGKKWYVWLKNLVEKNGIKFIAPNLPKANNPILDEWIEEIKKTNPDRNTILIGHSRGGVAILRWLEKAEKDIKIGKVILVAANKGDENKKSDFYIDGKFNYEKIKKHCDDFVVIHSRDDEWVSFESGIENAKGLEAKFYKLNDKGHFGRKADKILEIEQELFSELKVFTTRPDTLFGATFMVVAPEHELISDFQFSISNFKEVEEYITQAKKKSDSERMDLSKEKTGVELKGIKAVNPVNGQKIPIFVADYVLMSYGTGAIMAVPAHDERDWEFAKKYNLEIIEVIKGGNVEEGAFTEIDSGEIVNSDFLNGLKPKEAIQKMIDWLEEKGLGKYAVQYKLHDWIFSRQRYWGEPIPMVYCEQCGWQPVPEDQLPVTLPEIDDFQPTEEGDSPLARVEDWVKTSCPKCGDPAKRETDVMPNWAGSNWYFLRYCDNKNSQALAGSEKLKYWIPVDWYNGGMEHTTLHLLYSRFVYKFLYDIGAIPKECGPEPYKKRTAHGMILGAGGVKMSKSKGNVINPDEYIEKYGADTIRVYEMFMGPFDQAIAWDDKGVIGVYRFLNRVWELQDKIKKQELQGQAENNKKLVQLLHQTIKKVTEDIENMRFNTAIAQMMVLVNKLEKSENISQEIWEKFVLVLSPFAPHLAEEMWQRLGHQQTLAFEAWPEYDESLIQADEIELVIQVNGKVRDKFNVSASISEEEAKQRALASERVQKWLAGKQPKKIIYIKGKLVSIVV